ncbi:MAG: DUF2782 domain-containing protein [Dokdonella sp.]
MQRLISLVLSAALLPLAGLVLAQSPQNPTRIEPPPPPSLEDKGIYTKPAPGQDNEAAADAAAQTTPNVTQAPDKPDTRLVRDKPARQEAAVKERVAASQLTVRQEGKDTVEEYREDGKVWMIRIVPPDGPNRIFMDNTGTGRLSRDPKLGPIDPVYYTIYEWN